jgi:hypothetical protein
MDQTAAEPERPARPTAVGRPQGIRAAGPLRGIKPRDAGYALAIALAALFVYLVYGGAHIRELGDANALDYAQIARHLARGEGFTTSFIRPLSLAQVQNISHHPDLSYPPLHPLWMSLFFRLGGANHRMAAWSCGVPYLLSLPLVYLLGVRLFDRRVALLALALFGINYLCLQYAVSGLEVSLATLFVTLLLLALHAYLSGEAASPVLAALCGVLVGLVCLVKYVYIVLLLPVLLAVLLRRGEKRYAEALLSLAMFAVVLAPWAIRNARVTGNPVFTLRTAEIAGNTKTYKGQSLYRQYVSPVPATLSFLAKHPREAWMKIRPHTLHLYDATPRLGGQFIAALFIAAVLMRFANGPLRTIRLVHYAWIALMAATICLLSADTRLLVPLSPLVVVVGAACFLTLLDRLAEPVQGPRLKRRLMTVAVAGLLAVCWYPVAARTMTMDPRDADTKAAENVRSIGETLAKKDVSPVYTDQPWVLAWYGDINAIWLPQTEDDLHALERELGPIRYMVLSPVITTAAEEEGLAPWASVYGAARRGVALPYERFVAADFLGEGRDWVLFGRVPTGLEGQPTPAPGEAP